MARTIQNNTNDLKAIKSNLALFLIDYFKNNLVIKETDDINILTIQKSAIFDKLKDDITTYLYGDGIRYKNDFDFSLSYQLKHNNDFDITNDLKAIFDKTYREQIKTIKEHQKATERVTIDYFLTERIKDNIEHLIEYTKRRYKVDTIQALDFINTENVKSGLFEDIKKDLFQFVGDNLSYEQGKRIFEKEFKRAIKERKAQTPRTPRTKKDTNKLIDTFLILKKW